MAQVSLTVYSQSCLQLALLTDVHAWQLAMIVDVSCKVCLHICCWSDASAAGAAARPRVDNGVTFPSIL